MLGTSSVIVCTWKSWNTLLTYWYLGFQLYDDQHTVLTHAWLVLFVILFWYSCFSSRICKCVRVFKDLSLRKRKSLLSLSCLFRTNLVSLARVFDKWFSSSLISISTCFVHSWFQANTTELGLPLQSDPLSGGSLIMWTVCRLVVYLYTSCVFRFRGRFFPVYLVWRGIVF